MIDLKPQLNLANGYVSHHRLNSIGIRCVSYGIKSVMNGTRLINLTRSVTDCSVVSESFEVEHFDLRFNLCCENEGKPGHAGSF